MCAPISYVTSFTDHVWTTQDVISLAFIRFGIAITLHADTSNKEDAGIDLQLQLTSLVPGWEVGSALRYSAAP